MWFWLNIRVELARILLGLGRLDDVEEIINVGLAEAEIVNETIISRGLRICEVNLNIHRGMIEDAQELLEGLLNDNVTHSRKDLLYIEALLMMGDLR